MKFIVDRMLGRFARWLRLFGYDTLEITKQENEDDLLLTLAKNEGRILVSRDVVLIRKATKKGIPAYLIRSPDIREQLLEMKMRFDIAFEPVMDRCTLCNAPIRRVEPSERAVIQDKEYVYLDHTVGTEFWICDACGQVYWQGKHWKNIQETVDTLKGLSRENENDV